jgi:hypothetical protein
MRNAVCPWPPSPPPLSLVLRVCSLPSFPKKKKKKKKKKEKKKD